MLKLIQYIRKFYYIYNYLKCIFNIQIKILIYLSLVQSILSYGITLWGQAYDPYTISLKSNYT